MSQVETREFRYIIFFFNFKTITDVLISLQIISLANWLFHLLLHILIPDKSVCSPH